MSRRIPIAVLLGVLAFAVACTNKKVTNPLATLDSKQPDKVLFDRSMNALKHNKFDVARLTLQTLINTYPDSEYIARAKLGVADSWYAEGGSAALAQAEIEYNDFITFFPNMPEAAEAQLKIANIHYQQMEKPDRDYTHALRAQQEYRRMIQEFPDSKLVPVAKQRLLEVQEVLAEREFQVGKFYYLKQSYGAGIARLQSVVDQYPLYSKADEALYLLGQSYESLIALTRERQMPEAAKAAAIADFTHHATDAYSRILTRYPLMDRSDEAKLRLEALHQPVPRPTKAAVLQNKAEEDSRRETTMLTTVIRGFSKHPDVASAARTGEPAMTDQTPVSATDVVREMTDAMLAGVAKTNGGTAAASATSGTTPAGAGQPGDSSAQTATIPPAEAGESQGTAAGSVEIVGQTPAGAAASSPPPLAPANPRTQTQGADQNELKPNVPQDSNELKPNVPADGTQELPPPPQVNEIQQGSAGNGQASAASSDQQLADDAMISSSKHKKKKGLKRIIP